MTTPTPTASVPGGPVFDNEYPISDAFFGTPSNPHAAALNDGRIATVWEVSGSPDGATPSRLYAQVHGEGGVATSPIFELASSIGGAEPLNPQITALKDGSFVIAYTLGVDGQERVAYRVVSNGTPGREQFVESHGVAQLGHAITTLENGDFVIGWTENGAIMTQTLVGRADSGLPLGEWYASASSLGNTGAATSISLTHLQDDDFALAFVDVASKNVYLASSENRHDIFGGDSGFDGGPVDNGVVFTQMLNDGTEGAKRPSSSGAPETAVATLVDGRVVVVWDSWETRAGSDIAFRIVDTASGQFSQNYVQYASGPVGGDQAAPSVVALTGGGFVVAWENNESGFGEDIMARRFDANGVDHGGSYGFAPFPLDGDGSGTHRSPALVALDGNNFGAVWLDTPVDGYGTHVAGRVSFVPPLAAPDLDWQSDNGASREDNVTSWYELRFAGAIARENEASSVTVYVDMNGNGKLDSGDLQQKQDVSGDRYDITLRTPQNIEGSFDVYAVAHDAAGTPITQSEALRLTIDTVAPTNTVLDAWFGDRNSPAKMVTNSTQPTVHFELAQALREGEAVQYYKDTYGWVDLMVPAGQTQWSAGVDLNKYMPYGELSLRIVDRADNTGQTFRKGYEIDNQGPNAFLDGNPYIQMPTENEFVIDIRYEEWQSGFAPGTFQPGNITVKFGDTVLDVIAAQPRGPLNGNGEVVSYTVRAPGGSFDRADAGEYLVSFNPETVRDGMGNPMIPSSSFSMFIEARPVPTPSNPTLAEQSDTGNDFHDGVTKADSLTVNGTSNDVDGARVTAFIDVNDNGRFDADTDRAGSGTVQGGAWSVQNLDASGLEGSYELYAFNPEDPANTMSMPGYVTIDHTAPDRTVAVALDRDHDNHPGDRITNNPYQDLTGTLRTPLGDGDVVEVMLDSTLGWVQANTYGGSQNWWLYDAMLNRSGDIQVRITDRAGNVGEITHHAYLFDNERGTAQIDVRDVSMPVNDLHSFTITYTDAGGAGIDLSTIGIHNVQVLGGPAFVTMQVVDAVISGGQQPVIFGLGAPTAPQAVPQAGPQQVTVTYTVQAPGGSWDSYEAGSYGVYLQPSVMDMAGNEIWSNQAPTFNVTLPAPHINTAPTGGVTISGVAKQGETLTAGNDLADVDGIAAGSIGYQWFANGAPIPGATGATLVLEQRHVGQAITVVASYVDEQGAFESKASLPTADVANVNDAPTGGVTISGVAKQGQILTAGNDLADADGIAAGSIGYQWQADGVDIAGATRDTLVLGQAQVGKAITVVARYVDQMGAAESKTSVATTDVANVNDEPAGSVTIAGTVSEGETLTASNTLADLDGIADGGIAYQWQADGVDIAGATGDTLVLTAAQLGKAITVVASYTDEQGTAESITSAPTAGVANANDAPTGGVTISGVAKQGQTLAASNDLADADGIAPGSIGYQWFANGAPVTGATGATLVLEQQHVGKIITVVASYVDEQGAFEKKASAPTVAVANTNDAPTGGVTIGGVAMQGAVLTAGNTLADADGISDGGIAYQWQADGVDIAGATRDTLVLGQAQVGKAITVVARYTDGHGTQESVAAAPTARVADVNDKPTLSLTTTAAAQYVAGSAGGATLFANVALSTVETDQAISEVTLRVGGLLDAANETLNIGGKSVALVAGGSLELEPGVTVTLVLEDGALQLSIRHAAGWSVAGAKALIEGIQYRNVAAAPTLDGERTFEITAIKDNGGTAHHGADTALVSFVSTAGVVAAPVVPAPETPPVVNTSTVDGVILETSQVSNPDGTTSQTVTIPVVTPSRVEETGNNTVADIPLVKDANGETLLTAQVSTGLGLSITGSTASKSAGDSLTDLIREIKAHTAAGSFDQNQLTGGGSGFLSDLPDTTKLLVQTIVPTVAANGVAGNGALVINGIPAASGNPMTALVIDAKALPSGTNIQLNNVEFAAVIGDVRVTGGAGSQNVWGDGGSQTIFLGADDDVLHGGAGNDIVGSAGGNDKVYGDEGDDIVFGGEGDDYVDGGAGHDIALMAGAGRADYSFRIVDGNLVMTHLDGGADGIDTIANVETLRFAAAASDLSIRGTVNRLVEAFTGQQGGFAATESWIDAYKNGAQELDIADAMLGLNAEQGAMSNADFVASLYQNVLHRAADAAGAAAWVDVLDSGTASRAAVALGFANSAEKLAMPQSLDIDFNQTEVATLVRMYSALFDRAADEGGLNFWIAHYENGGTLSSIADYFVASSEHAAQDKASNADFVAALYQSAFHRAGDAEGLAFWVGVLDAGAVDKGDVLLAFAESAEKIDLVGEISTSIVTM